MGGSPGKQAPNLMGGQGAANNMQSQQLAAGGPQIGNLLNSYASGGTKFGDLSGGLKSAADQYSATPGLGDATAVANANAGAMREGANELATNPLTGTQFATDQVQNNGILGGTFGQGGTLDRTTQMEQDQANKGFSLQPEDNEAYGQASGNIARMFGAQGNNLAQSLADRGLSSAPSGAAGAAFSGLEGNKDEQLAKSQMQIAQARMDMNQQRLGQTRNFLSQLSGQGAQAINNQAASNRAGIASQQAGQKDALMGQQAGQNQQNEGFEQEQATKAPSLGESMSNAAQQGIASTTGKLFGKGIDSAAKAGASSVGAGGMLG